MFWMRCGQMSPLVWWKRVMMWALQDENTVPIFSHHFLAVFWTHEWFSHTSNGSRLHGAEEPLNLVSILLLYFLQKPFHILNLLLLGIYDLLSSSLFSIPVIFFGCITFQTHGERTVPNFSKSSTRSVYSRSKRFYTGVCRELQSLELWRLSGGDSGSSTL